jgi:soluble lytic murein transglycosylase-like protein
MLRRPSLLSGALRLMAVGLGTVAVLIVLQRQQTERPNESIAQTSGAPSQPAPAPAAPAVWALRTGGWYIRVDGCEIAIPSVGELTAAGPPSTLATDVSTFDRANISPFDHMIVHHAQAEGFDWRLIAALIFEESRFKPTSRSDKGAYGLMQVRPIAATAVGADQFHAPDDNVKTGVRYLRQLDNMFHEASERDRLNLVLAAYNIGPGHVRDAQTLARRFGYNPNQWRDSIALMLPLLEEPAIFEDVANGFAKGSDTVAYVQRIIERYHRYQRESPNAPGADDVDALSSSDKPSTNG